MGEMLSRCCFRCDICLAFRQNVERNDRRQELSDGWHRHFGFRVEHGHIVCDGCTAGRTVSERDRERFNRPCENRIRIEEPRARGEPGSGREERR